jgi:hypothetical protein
MAICHAIANHPRLRALGLWVALCVAVCTKTALLGQESTVYRIFAGASRHWWANQSLYASYTISEGLDGYRYSPAFAVFCTPFYLLGDPAGAICWSLASICMLVWALHALARDVLPELGFGTPGVERSPSLPDDNQPHTSAWLPRQEGWFLALAMVGSTWSIWSGQSNALVTALILLGLSSIARRQWTAAAWLLSAPVFIKLWPLALVLLLACCWPRQLIWRLAVACAVLALIPFLTRPPSIVLWQYAQWYESLTGPLQARWPGYRDAWTVWEQLAASLQFQPDSRLCRHAYTALQLFTAAALLGWCLWQRRHTPIASQTGPLLMLILSMWACWQLLCGPGTEQLTYGIVAPSASWALIVAFAEKRARPLMLSSWAILSLLPAGDIEQALLRVLPAAKALLPLGTLLLASWLLWRQHRLK